MQLTGRREALLVSACVVLYLALAGMRAWHHPQPYYDDVGFLDLANQAREMGGPVALLKALFTGSWLEDNRNPLYVGVLSLVAGRDHGFHLRARIVTVLLGAAALLAWWRIVRRRSGAGAALVVAAFLAVSECFVDYSGRESCEPLLLLLWALATSAILEGFENPRRWVWAGVFAGLAQLDKGSGIFLVFCFAVALLVERGSSAVRDPWAWGMGMGFVAAASPLLVRNFLVYGSPLHHWNTRLLWIDRLPDYAEIYAPGALDRLPHGLHDWLQHTTWHQIWFGRVVMGVAETAVHLGDSLSFVAPSPLGPVHIPGVVLGFGLFAMAVRRLYLRPASFERTFLLVQAALFVAFFVVFSAAGGSSRYVFPMTLCLLAFVLAQELARRPAWLARWSAVAASFALLSVTLAPARTAPQRAYAEAGTWLERNLKAGDGYAVDSRSQFEPEWFLPASTHMEIVSSAWQRQPVQPSELLPWLREKGVRFVLVDYASQKDGAPRWLFFDHLPEHLPWGLREVWSIPGRMQILEVSPAAGAREAALRQ
ncbi:MAG TPA: glycosyltransferase family 39 protein [Myxococcales bacterium]